MSNEPNTPEVNEMETAAVAAEAGQEPVVRETSQPQYAPVTDTSEPNPDRSLHRFLDVEVTVSAELGRVTIPIGDLVELGEGSVVELNRSVTSPVDLMAQGQRVATGEVVVIDDCFAVRIKSIESDENQ